MGVTKKQRGVDLSGIDNLSENQKRTIKYLTVDFLIIPQIAKIEGKTRQAVYKTINKLMKKGVLKQVGKGVYILGGYSQTSKPLVNENKTYRLHALSYIIDIQESSVYYQKILSKRSKDELENNSLMLYKDKILIYLKKDFWNDNINDSVKDSVTYINNFITKIENNYKIMLIKGRKCNLKEFKGELARVGDPIAREINLSDDKFKVYDDRGVLRLLVDKSFNFDELEAVSQNYRDDFTKIEKHYKEILEKDELMTLGEMQEKLKNILDLQEVTTLQILKLTEIIKNN